MCGNMGAAFKQMATKLSMIIAIAIILLFVALTTYKFLGDKPAPLKWSFRLDNIESFYGVLIAFVIVSAAYIVAILKSKKNRALLSSSIIISLLAIIILETFSSPNENIFIALLKAINPIKDDSYAPYYFPQTFALTNCFFCCWRFFLKEFIYRHL